MERWLTWICPKPLAELITILRFFPHQVRDYSSARILLNSRLPDMKELYRFVCDPNLTTLGPSPNSKTKFDFFSVPHPSLGGYLVNKGALLDYNSFSFQYRARAASLCCFCQICHGLYLLPDHLFYLCYWWPEDFKEEHLTPDVVKTFRRAELSVCYIHFVTRGKLIPGRDINLLEKAFRA